MQSAKVASVHPVFYESAHSGVSSTVMLVRENEVMTLKKFDDQNAEPEIASNVHVTTSPPP